MACCQAATRRRTLLWNKWKKWKHSFTVNLTDIQGIFNAGVMLLNLRILRRRDSLLLAGGSYQGWCEVFVSMKLLLLPWMAEGKGEMRRNF